MNRTSISDLKSKAKDQLLGNYKIATGSFALLCVLIYAIMGIIISSISSLPQIAGQVLAMLIGAVTTVFSVGYIYILRKITIGQRPVISDLFFAFRNHPDKVIIISLILAAIQFILLMPSTIVQERIMTGEEMHLIDGKMFLLWVVLYLIGLIISFVIQLMFAMCYMIYIDDPEIPVRACIAESISMMKGNKFRYFYMILSLIGYWLLAILSLGIAVLFVVPFQIMTMIEFYIDLKGEDSVEVITESYGDYFGI